MDDILDSPRLHLRPLRTDDARHVVRLLGDDREGVERMSHMPWPLTGEAVRRWVELRTDGSGRTFAITQRPDEAFLGAIGLSGPLERPGLGYWIGRPYRGRGFATEAVRLVVDFARRSGAKSLYAETFPDNPASARVLARAGFVATGRVRRDLPARGGLRDLDQHDLDLTPTPGTPPPTRPLPTRMDPADP